MDSFGVALRQSISDHLGHKQDVSNLRRLVDAFGQAANLSTIQSLGGEEIYASGMRPGFNITNALVWDDVEEHISLQTFVGDNNEEKHCPIEEVPNLEVRIGNRVSRFADATRTMCACLHQGQATFYYIFEPFIPEKGNLPPVEVVVVVYFTLRPEVVAARNLSMRDMPRDAFQAALNPTQFSNEDVKEGSVTFDLSLSPWFPRQQEHNGNEEEEGGN